MSAFVEEEERSAFSHAAEGGAPAQSCCAPAMMAWTDAESGQHKVLAVRRDPVTGDTTMTEEQAVERAHYTGSPAEKKFMERRWCELLRQAMLRVDKRKRSASVRAVERAAKRQCKKDERQTEALRAKIHPYSFFLENLTKFLELENCASGFPILPQLSLDCSMSSPIRRCVLRNGT